MIKATTRTYSEDGKVYVEILGVTSKYVTEKEIDEYNRWAPNQNVIYRHHHPSSILPGEILGNIVKSDIVDVEDDDGSKYKGLNLVAEMMEFTPTQKAAVEYMQLKQEEGDPIKMSIGKQTYGKEGEPPLAARPFEFSLTDIPVCEECAAVNVTMGKEEEARIAELKKALDEAVILNKELEAKVTKFEEAQVDEPDDKQANTEAFEAALQEKVKQVTSLYEEKFSEAATKIKAMEEQLEAAKRTPILGRIAKLEKDEMLLKEVYPNQSTEWLEKREAWLLKNKSKRPMPVTKRMEESRAGAESEIANFKTDVMERLNQIDPRLAKVMRGGHLSDNERWQIGGE